MKRNFFITASLFLSSILGITSCSNDEMPSPEQNNLASIEILDIDGLTTRAASDFSQGVSSINQENLQCVLEATDPLTADEITFLYAIREDEKLEHDLYNLAFTKYPDLTQLNRFVSAATSHLEASERILTYYEVSFPSLSEEGVFADETRQAIYNEKAQVMTSISEVYQTLSLLEEENIQAYEAVLDDIENVNIKMLVENLLRASKNHLRALNKMIIAIGETYTPTIISVEDYEEIINTSFQRGKQYQQNASKGNSNASRGGNGNNQAQVLQNGDCTGSGPTNNNAQGQVGKGYRGNKK